MPSKLPRSIRQLSTHVLAIVLGVVLTVGTLSVSPSQAEPAPSAVANSDSTQLIAQRQSPAAAAVGSSSFVTAAVRFKGLMKLPI